MVDTAQTASVITASIMQSSRLRLLDEQTPTAIRHTDTNALSLTRLNSDCNMARKRFLLLIGSICFVGRGSADHFVRNSLKNQAAKDDDGMLNFRSWTNKLLTHLTARIWKISPSESAKIKLDEGTDGKLNTGSSIVKRAAPSNATSSRKNDTNLLHASGSGNVTKNNATAHPKSVHNTTRHANSSTVASTAKTKTNTTTNAPKVTKAHSNSSTVKPPTTKSGPSTHNKNVSSHAPNGTASHTKTTTRPKNITDSPKHRTSTKIPKVPDNKTVSHNASIVNATDNRHKAQGSSKSVNKTAAPSTTNKPKASPSHKNASRSKSSNNTEHEGIKGKSISSTKVKTTTTPRDDLYGIEKSDEEYHSLDFRKHQPYVSVVRLPVRLPIEKHPSKPNKPYNTDHATNADSSKSYIPSDTIGSVKESSGYVHNEPIERHPSKVVTSSNSGHVTDADSINSYIPSDMVGSVKDSSGYVPIEKHPSKVVASSNTGRVMDAVGSKSYIPSDTVSAVRDSSGYAHNEPIERHPSKVINPSNAGHVADTGGSKPYIPGDASGSSSQEHSGHYGKGSVPALLGFKYLPAVDSSFNSQGYVSSGTVKDSSGNHQFKYGGAVSEQGSSYNKEHVVGGHGADVSGAKIYGVVDDSGRVGVAYVPSSQVKDDGSGKYSSSSQIADKGLSASRGSASRGRVKDAEGSRLYVPWSVVGTPGEGGASQGYVSSGRVKDAKGSRQYESNSVVIDDGSSSREHYDPRVQVQTSSGSRPYDADGRLREAVVAFSRGYDHSGSSTNNAAAVQPYPFGGHAITKDNFSRGSASIGKVNDAAGSRYYGANSKVKGIARVSSSAYAASK